ncbi:hypothetical protein TCDM_13510 [Trypanosoma cruzi Dm28c]|uniref:Uncharacterized protein n=1 Tax=Trypanosoma cruzi Dm28c TaxID=1416333 RepID=V5AN46_TRYCR|nr:hypothetical protein TCDM_13510 [Trypanosoma cruzi Dm28c]
MRGVHLAPRHAQHSASRRHHARTRVQRIFATEHSRVHRNTNTDKLQHRAVHHHRPPTSHHRHEGNAGHNQHGPHESQARQHQHRCVRRGLRAGKIHKRRRPRGNQQGVRHRQHRPRGKRPGQHKRTVQRLHIAQGRLHRPALVAPRTIRTAQPSTAHHVQHGTVQQRHVLHNDPHAVPRHPRHVEHSTHAVQHNVAQRHLARTGRHNEHRPHRHALAEKHTRRSAHSGRQHGSSHRHARLAHAAEKATARVVEERRRQHTEARQRSTESDTVKRSPRTKATTATHNRHVRHGEHRVAPQTETRRGRHIHRGCSRTARRLQQHAVKHHSSQQQVHTAASVHRRPARVQRPQHGVAHT